MDWNPCFFPSTSYEKTSNLLVVSVWTPEDLHMQEVDRENPIPNLVSDVEIVRRGESR